MSIQDRFWESVGKAGYGVLNFYFPGNDRQDEFDYGEEAAGHIAMSKTLGRFITSLVLVGAFAAASATALEQSQDQDAVAPAVSAPEVTQ